MNTNSTMCILLARMRDVYPYMHTDTDLLNFAAEGIDDLVDILHGNVSADQLQRLNAIAAGMRDAARATQLVED